ncbi:MAG: lipopolysaccharide heptosyltransferase II [Ignavibacteriales bacterium]|nr:lipopolysaccharide heptosyltransferase II [Ignavibacteriales bacterium]
MGEPKNIVVIQTAFIGDAVLTLPLIQVLRKHFPGSSVDIVVTPGSRDLFVNHPDIRDAIAFDKRGKDRGIRGLLRLAKDLQSRSYDLALIPHRSLRSAALALIAGIPRRIGFDRSAGRFLMTATAVYHEDLHEIDRNLSLLHALEIEPGPRELPRLYPSEADRKKVDRLLIELEIGNPGKLIAIAPGTIWNTKRWPKERFASLAVNFDTADVEVVLIGGIEDEGLCNEIRVLSNSSLVYDASGTLTLLQSAELLRRCRVLVCNDSAPLHLAAAVGTPVVAIFGATVPAFGFGPTGPFDVVVETIGLKCRPCSIHGGEKCPIKTFACMHDISHDRVFRVAMDVLSRVPGVRDSVH